MIEHPGWTALAIVAPWAVVAVVAIFAGYEVELRVTRVRGRGRFRVRGGREGDET